MIESPADIDHGETCSQEHGMLTNILDPIICDRSTRRQATQRAVEVGEVRCQSCGCIFRPDGSRKKFCDPACYRVSLCGPIEPRFWAKVNKNGPVPAHVSHLGSCWVWTASTLGQFGYGQFVLPRGADGKQLHVYAHRVAWELQHGPIPAGLQVLHRCDQPLCQRGDHLFLGTQADNLADAHRKGRLVDGLGARKLSDEAYRDILSSSKRGHGVAMMRKYGVSKVTVSRIRNGRQGSTFHHSESQRRRSA